MCVWGTEGCVGGRPVQRTNGGGRRRPHSQGRGECWGAPGGGREQGVYPACCPPCLTPGRREGTLLPSHGDSMRAMGLCPPLGPTAQALPSALTRELLCLPTGGGLGLTAPHSPCEALWPLPKPSGQPRGGPQRDAQCHPLTLCSQPIPDLLGCPPPQPWQRRTPSSRALPPAPGKTLHQMVLTPGPPTSPPRAVPSLHTGGTAGSPPKGLFMAAPSPPPSMHPTSDVWARAGGSPSSSDHGQHQ